MADWKLRLYHHLPPYARDLVATLHGYELRRWRYGPETKRLVEEALERDRWTADQWKSYQEGRLEFVLKRAATQVPYYRQQWAERQQRGDHASWRYLENWPILEKEALRSTPQAFVADDCDTSNMFNEYTSGSTGTPLHLWWSRDTVRRWYALMEARIRYWHDTSIHERWAILGGKIVVPNHANRPPFWVWNAGLNQLYMSIYHLSSQFRPYYLDAIKRYGITHIWAYTSAVYDLAVTALELGHTDTHLKVVITNAEPVYMYQRTAIEKAFHCQVNETYGMSEIVSTGSQCRSGTLHLWPEVGITEVERNGQYLDRGESGDLVCTGLFNADMPLIRYRVGDTGTLSRYLDCSCGRHMPAIAGIEGRIEDILYMPDGRPLTKLEAVFKGDFPIREAQIIQESPTRLRLKYVPSAGFSSDTENELLIKLHERVGDMEIVLECVDRIPRMPNGKFRAMKSMLSPEDRKILGLRET